MLLRAWLANPLRGAAGIIGIALLIWAVLPLARQRRVVRRPDHELIDFVEDVEDVWRQYRPRAAAGIAGVILFLWSAWPITDMR